MCGANGSLVTSDGSKRTISTKNIILRNFEKKKKIPRRLRAWKPRLSPLVAHLLRPAT